MFVFLSCLRLCSGRRGGSGNEGTGQTNTVGNPGLRGRAATADRSEKNGRRWLEMAVRLLSQREAHVGIPGAVAERIVFECGRCRTMSLLQRLLFCKEAGC